ncbi:hypothetical protein HJ019_23175 [Vibrio parahaemolyticus]|nr:hypothetical protein [Vibrio parahaemolyticus]
MEVLKSPYLWTWVISIGAFLATEFFFPVSDDNPNTKRQKHFWAIAFFIIISGQGLVMSRLFDYSNAIDTKFKQYEKQVNEVNELVSTKADKTVNQVSASRDFVVTKVDEYSAKTETHYNNIDLAIKGFSGMFGSVTGIEEVTRDKPIRILVSSDLEDTVVVYDQSSGKFPILTNGEKTDYWVRLTNPNLLSKPVIELRISPRISHGPEKDTDFVFGVSERVLKLLSGGKNTTHLRVDARIVKRST